MTQTDILTKQRSLIEDLHAMHERSTPNPRFEQIITDLRETNEQLQAIASPVASPSPAASPAPSPASSAKTAKAPIATSEVQEG